MVDNIWFRFAKILAPGLQLSSKLCRSFSLIVNMAPARMAGKGTSGILGCRIEDLSTDPDSSTR
jgi:hypothetical protein